MHQCGQAGQAEAFLKYFLTRKSTRAEQGWPATTGIAETVASRRLGHFPGAPTPAWAQLAFWCSVPGAGPAAHR